MTPTWFEHPDLMNLIIGALVVLVGFFIKREFNRFGDKLTGVCTALEKKASADELEKFKKITFFQLHEHDHQIECGVADCKPKTTGVIIRERRT